MCSLIECNDDYSKTSVNLWEYYRDVPGYVDEAAETDSE